MIKRFRPTKRRSHLAQPRVGQLWEVVGKLQFDFLVTQGLRPDHALLDVGCGALRGGMHFVRYLDPDRYVGFDINPERIEAGRTDLTKEGLSGKNAVLRCVDDFDISDLGRTFDYAIAQSVFTHLPLNPIIRSLVKVRDVLAPTGRFFATFFEAPSGAPTLNQIEHPSLPSAPRPISTYFDRDPFHYDVDTLVWAAGKAGLSCESLGEWNHPRGQHMLVFRPA